MRLEINDPQLVLKATPPRVSKSILPRPRLGKDSKELNDKAVILINAPSGYGKTSLLGQWRREWLQRGAMVAWLTLDKRDEGMTFVRGLQVAMRIGCGRAGFGSGFEFGGNIDDDLTALTYWLAEVASIATDVVLILDDADALPELTVHRSLAYLLLNVPANLYIVVASRRRIPLPIADLLTHGEFIAVTTDMLRFTLAETTSLLTARFGSRIDPDASARLHDITEGWPLGIQLAVAAIEKSPDPREAARSLSARNSDIERYFVDCLISRLEPSLVLFLIKISVVESICPDLARVLTDQEDSRELLARLHAETPILAEGSIGDWSRIHHLAREFLLARFCGLPQSDQDQLHRRAAAWLLELGLYELAAQQVFAAHDEEAAFSLVELCLYDMTIQGRIISVLEWASRIPTAEIERHPKFRLAVGWSLAHGDRHDEALALITPILSDSAVDPVYRLEAAAIAFVAAYFADQGDRFQEIYFTWFANIDDAIQLPPHLSRIITNEIGVLTIYQGNPEQARYHCQRLRVRQNEGMDAISGWTECIIGFSYLWEGQVLLAEDALRAALSLAETHIGRRSMTAVMLAVTLAGVLWELDRSEETAVLLTDRLDVLEHLSAPESIIIGYRTAARLAALGGQEQRAFDLLNRLAVIGELRGMPRLVIAAMYEEIFLHASRNRSESCEALLRRREAIITDEAVERDKLMGGWIRLYVLLSRMYTAIAKHDWRAVLALSTEAMPLAEHLRRGLESIQIKLLRAVAKMRTGEADDALMAEAISLAQVYGLKRVLIRTHPDVGVWLSQSSAAPMEALSQPTPPPHRVNFRVPHVSLSALLTQKEREVLELLARKLSNKQIAIALDVSPETIKWHLKNLFGKLNAGTRNHALDRARMLGILDID